MPPYVPRTKYINYSDVTELQTEVMKFVDNWVHTKKTPVPRAEIIKYMQTKGKSMPITRDAINRLKDKGYIREAFTISNKTMFVQLRRV